MMFVHLREPFLSSQDLNAVHWSTRESFHEAPLYQQVTERKLDHSSKGPFPIKLLFWKYAAVTVVKWEAALNCVKQQVGHVTYMLTDTRSLFFSVYFYSFRPGYIFCSVHLEKNIVVDVDNHFQLLKQKINTKLFFMVKNCCAENNKPPETVQPSLYCSEPI